MAAGLSGGAGSSGSRREDAHRHGERFAALVAGDREEILTSYEQSLVAGGSPIVADERTRGQAVQNAGDILADVEASVLAGEVRVDEGHKLLAARIGESRARAGLHPRDSLHAAVLLFEVASRCLARHVTAEPELLAGFVTAVLALNESISRRIREATVSYTGYLLAHVHQAHLDERRRIARDLHDRLGEELSVALRQLELSGFQAGQAGETARAAVAGTIARGAIVEGMRRLREVTSDLRQDQVTNLEKALDRYLGSQQGGKVATRLRMHGDERWAPPTVLDEVFLIIREAIRNALAHAGATLIWVEVEVAPRQLCAWIEDDGRGFAVADQQKRPGEGMGVVSMRERAELLGGGLRVISRPGRGTSVEVRIPLPGRHHELSG